MELRDGPSELLVGLLEVRSRLAAGRPFGEGRCLRQAVGQHLEALLGALVEAALQTPSLVVTDLDQPTARRHDLGDLRSNLGLEPGVGGGQPGGRPDRLEQPRVIKDRRVVHQDPDRATVQLDGRHCPARSRLGEIQTPAPGVDVTAGLGKPVAHLEGRITQRHGEGVPQRPRRRLGQLDHQVGHGRPLPARAKQPDQETHGDRAQHRLVGEQDGLIGGTGRERQSGQGTPRERDSDGDGRLDHQPPSPPGRADGTDVAPDGDRDDQRSKEDCGDLVPGDRRDGGGDVPDRHRRPVQA